MDTRTRVVRALVALALVGVLAGCAGVPPVDARPSATPRNVEEDDDFGTALVFEVAADGSLSPTPDPDARRVWEMFEQVVTPIHAGATILTYRAGDSKQSDTLAYVYRDERHPDLWNLAANLAYADDRSMLLATLVHEYGHILSLNDREVPPDDGGAACPTLELAEGCATETSAIWDFQTRFWARYGDEAPDPASGDTDEAFYDAHEADFVSSYAATSVTEDFAETFMTFVLDERPTAGAALADKFDFFYDRPAYTTIRDRIRAEFGL